MKGIQLQKQYQTPPVDSGVIYETTEKARHLSPAEQAYEKVIQGIDETIFLNKKRQLEFGENTEQALEIEKSITILEKEKAVIQKEYLKSISGQLGNAQVTAATKDPNELNQAEGGVFKLLMNNNLITTDPFSPIDFDKMRELPKEKIEELQVYLKEDGKYNLNIDGRVDVGGKTEKAVLEIYDENIAIVRERIKMAEEKGTASEVDKNAPVVKPEGRTPGG